MRQKESSLLIEIPSCVSCDLDTTPGSITVLNMVSLSCFPYSPIGNEIALELFGKKLNVITIIKTWAS